MPVFQSVTVTDSAILKTTLQQFHSLAKLFVKALQQKNYKLLNRHVFDSSAKELLLTKLTKQMSEEFAKKEIDKLEPRAKKYFDQLVTSEKINWKLITVTEVSYQKFTYFPVLDIYISDVYIQFTYAGSYRKIKFDELLYMNGKWWLFLQDITVKK
jgi:hypothetical protein